MGRRLCLQNARDGRRIHFLFCQHPTCIPFSNRYLPDGLLPGSWRTSHGFLGASPGKGSTYAQPWKQASTGLSLGPLPETNHSERLAQRRLPCQAHRTPQLDASYVIFIVKDHRPILCSNAAIIPGRPTIAGPISFPFMTTDKANGIGEEAWK